MVPCISHVPCAFKCKNLAVLSLGGGEDMGPECCCCRHG